MKEILIDGSNISLHSAGRGKLVTLEGLARVVRCLLANNMFPYTVFDASFRYRTAADSLARKTFDHLTHNVKDYFQMSPRGEEADLFLLEMALVTGHPILSNDTFQKYGGVKDGVLAYRGGKLAVCNFQVFAGTVIIPDLQIRHRIQLEDGSLDGIEALFATAGASPEQEEEEREEEVTRESAAGLTAELRAAIAKTIRRYVDAQPKPLAPLGQRLADRKHRYETALGLNKRSRKAWFGEPTLTRFIERHFPEYEIVDGGIKQGPTAGSAAVDQRVS